MNHRPSLLPSAPWVLLGLLLAAVVLPAAAILWFMAEAVRNERIAAREKVIEAWRPLLDETAREADAFLGAHADALARMAHDASPDELISSVLAGPADSLLVYGSGNDVLFPAPLRVAGPVPAHELIEPWHEAERLEFVTRDLAAAAEAYAALAQSAPPDSDTSARARLARARCLERLGQPAAARALLIDIFTSDTLAAARDREGRLTALDAGLRAWQLSPADADLEAALRHRLFSANIPSAQRLFIAGQLPPEGWEPDQLRLLQAEALALALRETPFDPTRLEPGALAATPLPDLWALAADHPDGRLVALWRAETLAARLAALTPAATAHFKISPLPPGAPDGLLKLPLARAAGWRMAVLATRQDDPFAAVSDHRIALYFWSAGLLVAALVVLATLLGRRLLNESRLTRLKNDFIAMVTHELKTPLASTRVLVETLLDGGAPTPADQREYLELIARENARLCRLIDNFLTFSRMERGRQSFELRRCDPAAIARAAADAIHERMAAAGIECSLELQPNLPPLQADPDALVTLLLNLLDNAIKFAGTRKWIALRAHAAGGRVVFEVEDHGIGIARRDQRRIFERFYQADRSLAREVGGCGLGLAIVKFIAQSHGGTVAVESAPGRGSTFRVALPAARAMANHDQSVDLAMANLHDHEKAEP